MKVIKPYSFVIEVKLPVEKGEDLTKVSIEGDVKVKDLKYAWHWYGGLTPVPGSGKVHPTVGYVPPTPAIFWSPYIEDAEIFDDREKAELIKKNIIGGGEEYKVVQLEQSHYKETWKYNP